MFEICLIEKLGKLLEFLIPQSEEYLIRMFMTKPFDECLEIDCAIFAQ
jgi:hypothetical protein